MLHILYITDYLIQQVCLINAQSRLRMLCINYTTGPLDSSIEPMIL